MNALPTAWFPQQSASAGEANGVAPDAPSDVARRALAAWAESRGLVLAPPSEAKAVHIDLDLTVADRVESELAAARNALTRLDADATEHALARARQLLEAHPELPQAGWLMAEVLRGWAARWMRIAPIDVDRAARAWTMAAALDGGRAPGIGETSAPVPALVTSTFDWTGEADVKVTVDGAPITRGAGKYAAGEHAVVVTRDDAIVWADWVSIAAGSYAHLPDFAAPACSLADFSLAKATTGTKSGIDARGVRCGHWVAATAAAGGVRAAVCEEAVCGPLVLWQLHSGALGPLAPPPKPDKKRGVWIGVVVVGVVVVVAVTSIALAASGAFDSAPHETKFVGGGLKTTSDAFIPR